MGKLKRLRSKPAIAGWISIILLIWKILSEVDTLKGVVEDVNMFWHFLSTPFGMLILLFLGLGLIAFAVFKPERKKVATATKNVIEPTPETSANNDWLERELAFDLKRISKGMSGRFTHWNFSNIYNREPYIEINDELINTTLFTFAVIGVSGFMKIEDQKCVNPPQVLIRHGITRDEPAVIHLTQSISPETSKLIQEYGNSGKEVNFDLKDVVLEITNTTTGFEKQTPRLTGGEYKIVPKDGLKPNTLSAQPLIVSVQNAEIGSLLLDNGQRIIQFLVRLTLEASPEIQLGALDLVFKDNPYKPLLGLPTTLVKGIESYEVEYRVPGDAGRFLIEYGTAELNGVEMPNLYLHVLAGGSDFKVPFLLTSHK